MVNRNLPAYKPIEVTFLSEQKVDLGEVSFWRNNLVAASKRHNHLYIALRSSIRVYSPAYPNQIIPPNLSYITLTSSFTPTGPGYIDPAEPHAINSLTVGDLGFEEVLVSAHDDGDVCVWYTRDLSKLAFRLSVGESAWGVALHKERRLMAVSANNHSIHVFELAITDDGDCPCPEEGTDAGLTHRHRRRRRRKRDSFGYDGGGGFQGMCNLNGEPLPGNDDASKKRRKKTSTKNKTPTTLKGHGCNIPNVSFLDDPTGRWLVGTSIDGMVILWDVMTERPVEKCRLGMDNRGWSVLFLKPQAFKPVSNIYEALGRPVPEESQTSPEAPPRISLNAIGVKTISTDYYDPVTSSQAQLSRMARAWDISPNPGAHISGLSTTNDLLYQLAMADAGYDEDQYSEEEEDEDHDYSDGPYAEEEEDEDGGWSEGSAEGEVEVFFGPGGATVELVTTGSSESGSSHHTSSTDTSSDDGSGHYSYQGSDAIHNPRSSLNFYGPVQFVGLVQGSDSPSSTSSSSPSHPIQSPIVTTTNPTKRTRPSSRCLSKSHNYSTSSNSGYTSSTSSSSSSTDTDSEEETPAQPPTSLIFSTTGRNAHLLTVTSSLSPIVLCRSPLRTCQPHPSNRHRYAANIDRLNLCHAIPELSLVIAASQKGRVAVFRLTRVGDEYCMRLDDILPRESEFPGAITPGGSTALLGVAVGPIQGREVGSSVRRRRGGWRGNERRRRYRLMCVFVDGRVLSYEIGREGSPERAMEGGGGGMGVGMGVGGLGGFVMV
ncbi:unnamed protein product [Tuber melanosporum]|uniref:(Perigord truffle) hypothetical protein n=1 Tax=Tuber melanosporum (strain Mel28) TaxID=656061 RepID=D5GD81_TUBMM|nr:uncharacterized protein GSTUM_00006086001 [Tuber melanosporum]CAZ82474.1 unnamed protein product [Tuber melanosporum]